MGRSLINKDLKKVTHKRFIILIGILATLFSLIITSTGIFKGLESKNIDWLFSKRGEIKPQASIIIVAIDDESFAKMPERWTWPRNFYGKIIDNLKNWGAKVIAFDVIYSEPTKRNPKEDAIFANSIKKAGNVILGMGIFSDISKNYEKIYPIFPIKILADNTYGMGLIHHVFDEDSHIRKSYLFLDYNKNRYFALSLEILGAYYNLKKEDMKITKKYILWDKLKIKLHKGNQIIINYAGQPKTFLTVPFYKVYYGKEIKKEIFKDKIVFVGSTSELLHDVFLTPFSQPGVQMPGVEIHANVLNTIFTGNYISQIDRINSFLLLLLIGIFTSFLIFNIKAWQGLIVSFLEILFFVFLTVFIFIKYNYIITFVNPVFTIVLCYLSISTYKVAVEEREKRKIKNIFSRYVSKGVVDELLKTTDVKLGGEKRVLSVLFSDIRGFTSMSEKMQPEQVVSILNEFLSEMTDIIFLNRGTLDKFIGDAIMAVFGSPIFLKDHAKRAVKTAFMMKNRLTQLNEKWQKEGKHTLKIGIGINSGEVIAGNMGSLKRMEYTVIGDTVNLASRLESLNKELGTEILISENTYNEVKDFVEVKKFENIKIRGKEETITVFEVLEYRE
jgi:adenylate cyclase